jgi:hypothetical protein
MGCVLNRPRLALLACLLIAGSVAFAESAGTSGTAVAFAASEIEPPPFDPTGRWILTLPAGWQRKVTIEKASADTYFFRGTPQMLMNGVYAFDRDKAQFILVEADHEGQSAYDWQILNANTLELVHHETRSGGNYVGAILSRDFDWDEFVDNSRVPKIGSKSHRPATPRQERQELVSEVSPKVTIEGKALNDAQTGPYVESTELLVFVDREEPWPKEVVGEQVRLTGRLYSKPLVVDGEQIPAQRMGDFTFDLIE